MLVGLDEAGLHSMHAIMPSTSCHDLKRWPAVVVVVAAARGETTSPLVDPLCWGQVCELFLLRVVAEMVF